MTQRPSFQEFVEDEMLRAPLALDHVIDAVHAQWQQSPPLQVRMDVDPLRLLTRVRRELVADAIRELRRHVQSGGGPGQPPRVAGAEPTRDMELSLIDENEVAVDIEITRIIDRVKQVAEFEARELLAFTSALVDDVHVSRDTNPFRPEAYVRSLWHGVRATPMSQGLQGIFMRDAAEPLARVLRQSYAAACTRLEEQGVQRAAYRTIVTAATSRLGDELQVRAASTLADLRDNLIRPAQTATVAAGSASSPPGAAALEPQGIELLSRLFDAIHDDPQLSAPTVALLLRLQPTVLRIAVRDPALLETFTHPVWRLMDQLAFVLEAIPAAEHERSLLHCRRLIDQLASDTATNAARFEWAISRVIELDRHLLAQGIAAAQPTIGRLRSAIDTANAPLDVGTLDTIPADLLRAGEAASSGEPRAANLKPGDRLRAYLHGDWRRVQLLWSDAAADIWLLRDIERNKPWGLRGGALDRLLAEHLAQPLERRSLVRAAAQRVLRAAEDAKAAAD